MIIYNKSGIELCKAHKFTYSGTFMGETYITTTITSEQPIMFGIGAYCEYRGERFELNYVPSVEKVASTDSYGDAYKYEDVKFSFLANELSHCSFLDYVVDDNTIHYSGMPNFTFYGTVFQLAERIKANLDRIYTGDKSWTISVNPSYESAELNISATNISCMDALAFAKTSYGAHYIIRGRNITIGSDGVNVGHTFGYGIGNGLKNIKQVSNNDSSIITRLRSFGSTKNLPYRWYNKQINPSTGLPYIPDSMYVPNLMLPDFLSNGGDTYIDDNSAISKFGIREGVVYFDGTDDNYKEIYPTIEGVTANQLIAAGISVTVGVGDNGNLDEIKSVVNPTDNGIIPSDGTSLPSTFTLVLKDLGFDLSEKVGDNYIYATTDGEMTVSMKSGMATGYDFSIISITKRVVSGVITFELVCNRYSDTDIGMSFPNTSYPIASGDKFVLVNIQMPDVYIIAASQRLLSASTDYLSKNNYQKVSYEPELDNLFMARNPSIGYSLKEGDLFDFSDSDLYVNDTIIVKTLEIRDGDSMIPQYSIILSNEYEDSTIGKINSEITKIKVNTPTANQQNNWDLSSAYAHYHGNKSLIDLINQMNIDVLGHLSVDGGKLKSDVDFYSLGEISAFGAGSGGSSGGGLIQTVYGYSSLGSAFNNATLTDTFNAYTINQLHTRLSQVEVGAAINIAVSGSGNAVTGVTKNGNVLEFTKGLTFSLASHTHDYIPLSQKGTANGVASLDANGLIISAQLPSYVDDVIEVSSYANLPVSGESGKIYVTTDTNITYRWTGTIYVEISKSIALGETSSTAYRGDLGAIAYAHSQIAGGTGVHVSSTERTNWNLAYTNNHTHTNKSVLDGITSTLIANWNLAYTNNHTHANKSLLDAFSQSDNDVLNHLSIVDGKLKVDIDLYSLGEVSAFGAGSGGSSGGGLIQTVYGYSSLGSAFNNTTLTDTFNAYTINKINTDLGARITSLEAGSALTFTTAGSGNAVTSVTKSGTSVTVTKGLTFSVDGHTHTFASLTSKPTTLSGYGITDAYTKSYVDSTYLKLTGGTLSGNLKIEGDGDYGSLKIGDSDAINAVVHNAFWLGNTRSASLSTYNNTTHIGSIGVYDYPYFTNASGLNYTIWHSGNDGVGSGLDADLLRGVAPSNLAVLSATKLQTARTIAGVNFDGTDNISIPFANLSSIPTTISGYGITDAYTKTQIDGFLALKLDVATFNDLFEKVNIGTELSPVYAIKAKYNFYSVGEVSAFGAGAGSGGSGLIQTVYGYSGLGGTYNDAILTDTFNAYTINKINTDLGARITSLESGSALTFTTAGSGNAVTSVTKSGTSVTVTKGLTFSVDGHTHTFASLTSKPTTLSGYGITDAYTTSSADNTFLKLAGGTLNGNLFIPYNVSIIQNQNSTSNYTTAIKWYKGGVSQNVHDPQIGQYNEGGTGTGAITILPYPTNITPWTGTVGLFLTETVIKFNNNNIYHSGNFTNLNQLTTRNFSDLQNKPTTLSGYGITDALLASSYTAADVLTKIKTVDGSGSGLDADTLDGVHNGYLTANYFKSQTEGIDANNPYAPYMWYYGQPNSGIINWALNDGSYGAILTTLNEGNSLTAQFNWFINHDSETPTRSLFFRASNNLGFKNDWRQIAFTTSNVASATKLQNTRTIWGQSFNGEENVSGAMSGVTNITMGGALSGGTTSSFSSYSTADRFYAGYDSGAANSISCSNWFRSNGYTGWYNTTYGGGITMEDSTYVRISHNKAFKVGSAASDSINTDGGILAGNWVRTTGSVGWYSDTYGGGITMTDATYVRVYNNKAFWVDNNIVATGEITAFGASDIRLKSNIKPINSALGFLGKVKTYEFEWNEKAISLNPLKTKKGAGVIAQEMSLLDNNFVHSIYGEYLGVDYERFIPYLIGGVNELSKKMYDYGNRLDRAEKRVAELELEVKNIKNANNIL